MLTSMKNLAQRAAGQWLFRLRENEPGEVFLSQRRVFILPTRAGLGFALLLLVLLIGSTNYSLGLGFALTFAVASCAVVDMYFTYRNLAHLHLRAGRAQPVFAGEDAQFELHLMNRSGRDRYALWADFVEGGMAPHAADAPAGASAALTLSTPTAQRGWLRAPRVRLVTRFPLGLFRAWSYWQPDARVLVYPFPEQEAAPLPMSASPAGEGQGRAGHDDFAGVRSYQAGDPMRRLAWRQIARLDPEHGGQLVTKHFEGGMDDDMVLDFAALSPLMDVELRLSRMARWVLDAEQRALPYAFRIGARDFAPACGAAHRAACLRELALYGQAAPDPSDFSGAVDRRSAR